MVKNGTLANYFKIDYNAILLNKNTELMGL